MHSTFMQRRIQFKAQFEISNNLIGRHHI